MTYYVSSGTLNPTHSLTHWHFSLIFLVTKWTVSVADCCRRLEWSTAVQLVFLMSNTWQVSLLMSYFSLTVWIIDSATALNIRIPFTFSFMSLLIFCFNTALKFHYLRLAYLSASVSDHSEIWHFVSLHPRTLGRNTNVVLILLCLLIDWLIELASKRSIDWLNRIIFCLTYVTWHDMVVCLFLCRLIDGVHFEWTL